MISLHLLQARYWDSSASFESAKLLVTRKIWNMWHLLERALAYRVKKYPTIAQELRSLINTSIMMAEVTAGQAKDRGDLLRIEARATKAYWRGFVLLAHCPHGWHRAYPHAADPWNRALNIGYTMLANVVRDTVKAHDLSEEIGMLHVPRRGHEALVYDFEELFRQTVVDAAILHVYSRGAVDEIETKFVVSCVLKRLDMPTRYAKRHWPLRGVIEQETLKYKHALEAASTYLPYVHSWAHAKMKKRLV